MRMLDLLRHTSGLTYGFQNRSNVDAAYRTTKSNAGPVENWYGDADLDGFIADLAKQPLEFSPGEAWNYSVSTDVLGAVIQRVSGMPLDRYFAEKIFAPLKMHDTGFVVPADKVDRLTDCYAWAGPELGRVMYDRGESSQWLRQPKLVSGGGGLVSTALDYHRFCRMLENGGELDGARHPGPQDARADDHEPPARQVGPVQPIQVDVQRDPERRRRLRPGLRGHPGRQQDDDPRFGGRVLLGRNVHDLVLRRPGREAARGVHDPAEPILLYPIRRELKTLIYSSLT
jgi:CubicO group peptidase (beta-lactamase class C family)